MLIDEVPVFVLNLLRKDPTGDRARQFLSWFRELRQNPDRQGSRARETLALLIRTAVGLDKRLVLLIDNIDLILERISGQAWALREVLSEESNVLLIGASARALESSYQYDQPFYDFFQIRWHHSDRE